MINWLNKFTSEQVNTIILAANRCMWSTHFARASQCLILYISLCAVILVSCCQLLHVVAVLWCLAQCCEWLHCFPCEEHYCPHCPVNWLITSLMRMEQHVTVGTLSDSPVTSEPKTRTSAIGENGLRAMKIPEHEALSEQWTATNEWKSVSASDRCALNPICWWRQRQQTGAVCLEIFLCGSC